jgi:hypothetical protein
LTIAGQGAAASGIEATRFANVRFAGLLARLRVTGQAAVRMIGASRVGVTGLVGLLARTRGVLPLLCRLSDRIAVKTIGARSCSFLKVSTGIASLAILVATMLFLWPDNLTPPLSTGGQLSHTQDARPPADRKPVEPTATAQLAETQTPKSVPVPQPATAALAQPDPRRVTIRPKAPETQTGIPPPLRTWSLEPSRLQEPARSQDEARSQKAEASDPAIDWLLKGGRGTSRRSIESP